MSNCHSRTVSDSSKSTTAFARSSHLILGFLVLILPKCPFCVVAYSGAITLCGASTLITQNIHHTGWGAYLALSISVFIALCILLTGKPTSYRVLAIIMTLLGLLLICIGIFGTDAMLSYYFGASLLVIVPVVYGDIYRRSTKGFKSRFSQSASKAV